MLHITGYENTQEQPGVLLQTADIVILAGYVGILATVKNASMDLQPPNSSVFHMVEIIVGGMSFKNESSSGTEYTRSTYAEGMTNMRAGTVPVGFVTYNVL